VTALILSLTVLWLAMIYYRLGDLSSALWDIARAIRQGRESK
jgi:hypothetical protein